MPSGALVLRDNSTHVSRDEQPRRNRPRKKKRKKKEKNHVLDVFFVRKRSACIIHWSLAIYSPFLPFSMAIGLIAFLWSSAVADLIAIDHTMKGSAPPAD